MARSGRVPAWPAVFHSRMSVGRDTCTCPQAGFEPDALIAAVLGDPEGFVAVGEEVLDGRIDLAPVVERLAVNGLSRPNFYLGLTTVAAEANEAPWRVRGGFGHDEPPSTAECLSGAIRGLVRRRGFEQEH